MVAAYRSGDFSKITEIIMDPEAIAEAPERHKALFSDRNHTWVKTLKPILDTGGAFIAVGVGHFSGDEGLLALLKNSTEKPKRSRVEPSEAVSFCSSTHSSSSSSKR